MKRVLFTATVDSHICNFHLPFLKWFNEMGYEVHVASNGEKNIPFTHVKHNIPFERSPFKLNNIIAFNQLKSIINSNNFELIHCHTPMGGVITRLASLNARRRGTKVLYTAHGFHFFNGAPLINWFLYYPIEKWLSQYTDCLFTMNTEDYFLSTKRNFRAGQIININGVGLDLEKFCIASVDEKKELRFKYGFTEDEFLLIYVAELSPRKNQLFLIKSIVELKKKIPNIKLLLVGDGELGSLYEKEIKRLKLEHHISLLGYRKDIRNLMVLSDIGVSASKQEGMPVNVMEAMALGLPLVVSDCRGNRDLIENNRNGIVINLNEMNEFIGGIETLYHSKKLRITYGINNKEKIKNYSLETIMEQMKINYKKLISTSNHSNNL
ncbi:glycosyltransferase family 4 protein [Paenibacillus sp. FSL E2-0201]|uniref:glycosyltransferase family 4 protein n=1 Tax=Paenibacillus sp. FSL E2-0201 TaxID=2954726 RepID=UPI0030DB48BB